MNQGELETHGKSSSHIMEWYGIHGNVYHIIFYIVKSIGRDIYFYLILHVVVNVLGMSTYSVICIICKIKH